MLEDFLSIFIIIATMVFDIPMILNISKNSKDEKMLKIIKSIGAVSYTHQTLPTT